MEARPPSLGTVLRRARIERGLSLTDVEARLHVPLRQLEALELDDFGPLPPAVYTRALVRNYARLVGLDPAALLGYQLPARPSDRNPIRPAVDPIEKPTLISWNSVLVTATAILGIGLIAYLYVQYTSLAQSLDLREAGGQSLPTPAARAFSPLLTPQATGTAVPTPAPEPSATPISGLVVETRVVERSWLQVWADGRSVMAENLPAGTTRTFTASSSIRMRVGNAGGVDVTVNGVHQGRLGSGPQALDVAWGRD